MTDQQLLERRVRETLATRAHGVAATPALYERVQRGIRRDARWALARAWAMLATIVVLAGLVIVALPDDVGVDIVDDPADTTLDDADGSTDEDADGGVDTALPSDLPFGGVGYAQLDAHGRLTVSAPDGSSLVPAAPPRPDEGGSAPIVAAVDLAVPSGWTAEDGAMVVLAEADDGGREVRVLRMEAGELAAVASTAVGSPTGGRVAVLPDGSGVAWIEDLDLVVKPIAPGPGSSPRATSLDLPPNGPTSLVAQQVVAHDDGGLSLLATDPDALQAWSIPLQPGDVPGMYDPEFVPAPMPGFGAVLDVVSLPDGSLLSLEAPADGADVPFLRRTTFGPPGEDQVQPLPDLLWPNDGGFELDSGGGWQVTLHDGERGQVHRYLIDPDAAGEAPLATSRGADAAVAGVHVGSGPAAWGAAGGEQARAGEEELAALRDEQARLAQVVGELADRIAALEEQLEQTTTAGASEAIEEELATLRAALEREREKLAAVARERAVREAEADGEVPLATGLRRSYRVEDGRIVSSGGNTADPGAAPFPDEVVELGLLAANPAGSVFPETLTDLVVEVDRGTNRDLHLVAYTDGGSSEGPDGRTDVPAEATVAPLALGLDGPLTGLVRSPDGGWVAWTTSATLGLAEVSQDGLEIAAAIDVPTDLPLVDWVWEEPGEVAELGFAAPGGGTERATVDLDRDDGIFMSSSETVSSSEARVRLVDPSGAVAGAVALPASLDRVLWGPGGDQTVPPVWRAGEPTMRLTQGPGGVLVTIGSAAWVIDLDDDSDGRADEAPTIRELPSGTRAIG